MASPVNSAKDIKNTFCPYTLQLTNAIAYDNISNNGLVMRQFELYFTS